MIKELILDKFKDLNFEPVNHEYFLDSKSFTPVSNVVSKFYPKFDTQIQAQKYARKHGLDYDDVVSQWEKAGKDACVYGHKVHDFGERYFYNRSLIPSNGHEEAIVKFWQELPDNFVPVLCETRVYTKNHSYAGTFDLLLYDTFEEGLVVCDYKTNKDLFKNFRGQTMLPPFEYLLDTPFNHYQLQVSCYQIPLEEIGLKVSDRWIIWLKGDGTFSKLPTYDFTKYLKPLLN